MADFQPFRALHNDLAVAGPLQDLIAPPYDVLDAEQRAALEVRQSRPSGRSNSTTAAPTASRRFAAVCSRASP